jgi:hypothetical protein
VGYNVADDTTAIENALNSGKPIVGDPKKSYKITRTISVDSCNIVGNLNLVPNGSFMALDVGSGVIAATTTLAADVTPRATSITVANATGIQAGQIIHLVSSALWYYDNRGTLTKGELHLVKSVSGTTIELSEPVWDEYYIASETVTIRTFNPNTCYINGLNIKYPTLTETSGMRIRNLINPVVSNLKIEKSTTLGLSISQCYGATLNAPSMIECFQITSVTGYGIQDSASFGTVINAGYFYRTRRGVDFSGGFPSRGWIVSNSRSICWGQDDGDGFGTHGTAEFGTFIGNQSFGGRYGFMIRGGNIKVTGNKIWGANTTAVAHADGDGITVENNEYSGSLNGRTFNPTSGLGSFYSKTFTTTNQRTMNVIKGNTAYGIRSKFIDLSFNEVGLVVKDNECHMHSNGSGIECNLVSSSSVITLTKSKFSNNTIYVSNGIRKVFNSNVTVTNCDIDEREIPATDIVKWAGSGTLSNVVSNLKVTKQKGIVRIAGTVSFDVADNTVKINIAKIPQAEIVSNGKAITSTFNDVILYHAGLSSEIVYISGDALGATNSFAIGSYVIHINFAYKSKASVSFEG